MKKFINLFLFVALLIPIIARAEIPFGVTPKEIVVSGTIEPSEDQVSSLFGFLRSSGKLVDDYIYAEGNRIGVKLDSIDYSIHFWNVGKMGGTSGFLFWKKDFAKAVLYLDYNTADNGQIVGEGKEWKGMPGQPFWPLEPATGPPKVNQASCVMEFSGGPLGTFAGICNNGSKISGRIGAGSFIVFDKIEQPTESKEKELALTIIKDKELALNKDFSDWKFDETGLVDSGTRFNSLSGQVEIRHEAEPNGWKSAQLDSVLYVDDHIKTGDESSAILSFADMSTFLMNAETEIVLNSPPSKDNKLKMVYGKVMANIKKMMKDGSMEIDMSQAVAGIKGTRFILTETGSESKIEVTEGSVAFRSKNGNEENMVAAGESVIASASGLGEKTTFDALVEDSKLVEETSKVMPKEIATQIPIEARKNNNVLIIVLGAFLIIFIGAFTLIKKKFKSKRGKANIVDDSKI